METKKNFTILFAVWGLMVSQATVSHAVIEHVKQETVERIKKERVYSSTNNYVYSGRLPDVGMTVNGLYDLQFKLYDSPTDGNQVGSTIDVNDVNVIDGYFTVKLNGTSLFCSLGQTPIGAPSLEIGMRPAELEDPSPYTVLGPRQDISAVPYALHTLGIFVGEDFKVYMVGLDVVCPDDPNSYIQLDPNMWGGCNSVGIVMNEYRQHNKLTISAYDADYGNLIYSEDPQAGTGQGFGIAGGNHMAPFDRFVVNSDKMFLGYAIRPGDGTQESGPRWDW